MRAKISYLTQEIPPPFSYGVVMEFEISNNTLFCSFNMEYTDRENLSEEDILIEGFTLEDDFEWEGQVDLNWKKEIENLKSCDLMENPTPGSYIHIELPDKNGFPTNNQEINQLIQELIQMVFETSGIEESLKLELILEEACEIEVLFSNKTFLINKIEIDWLKGRELLQLVFLKEYPKASKNSKRILNVNGEQFSIDDTQSDRIQSMIKSVIS